MNETPATQPTRSSNAPKLIGGVVTAAIVISIGGWLLTNKNNPAANTTNEAVGPKKNFTDGTYEATGNYISPNGQESVAIGVTLKDNIITDATFQGNATNPTSIRLQTLFRDGFAASVVGKPIDEVLLTVINGSSLTPKGFMEALDKIKTEAAT